MAIGRRSVQRSMGSVAAISRTNNRNFRPSATAGIAAVAVFFFGLAVRHRGLRGPGAVYRDGGNWSGKGTITLDDGSVEAGSMPRQLRPSRRRLRAQSDPDLRQRQLQIPISQPT